MPRCSTTESLDSVSHKTQVEEHCTGSTDEMGGENFVPQFTNYKKLLFNSDLVSIGSEVITSGNCPSTCHSQLELVKEKLDCCSFADINTTQSGGYPSRLRPAFDNRVWKLCGVFLSIPPCKTPNLSVVKQNCTIEEFHHLAFTQGICLPLEV